MPTSCFTVAGRRLIFGQVPSDSNLGPSLQYHKCDWFHICVRIFQGMIYQYLNSLTAIEMRENDGQIVLRRVHGT